MILVICGIKMEFVQLRKDVIMIKKTKWIWIIVIMKVIWLHDGLNQLYIDKHAVSYDFLFVCLQGEN